jgi:hypothetical protein
MISQLEFATNFPVILLVFFSFFFYTLATCTHHNTVLQQL